MELKIPSSEQAYWGLRAMKTVALADGTLDDAELHLWTSVQQIFGTTHAPEQLSPITPADLAREFPDPQLRQQLVQGLIVMSLIDGKANAQETDLVEQFAQALEVSAPEVKDLRHVLKGEILQLRLDLARRFWLRDKVKDIWNTEGIRGIYKFMRGMIGKYEDTALAARYQALEHYPAGSLGRAYWEYCRANGFALPGREGRCSGTDSISRLRACVIRLRNGAGRRSPSRLFQRRLPAARPVALRLLRLAAIPRGHPYDADHQGQNGILRPGEGVDRDSAGGRHERGSEQRLGLLAGHGGAGRRTPQALQHPPVGNIRTGNSASSRECRMTKELLFQGREGSRCC